MNLLKTILPNQLVNPNELFAYSPTTVSGITFIVDSVNGTVTANGTATDNIVVYALDTRTWAEHKYILTGGKYSEGEYYLAMRGQAGDSIDYGNGVIWNAVNNTWKGIAIYIFNGVTVNNIVFKPQLIDLTLLYGQGLEPSTVADFKKNYPLPYYPYSLTNTTGLLTCANGAITADISSMLPSGIGVVDLGSLNWVKASPQLHTFYANFPTTFTTSVVTYICENYTSIAPSFASDSNDKCVYGNRFALTEIIITDSDYDDAVMFKTAMAGKMLIYKTS